jgi:hypothetical protein
VQPKLDNEEHFEDASKSNNSFVVYRETLELMTTLNIKY